MNSGDNHSKDAYAFTEKKLNFLIDFKALFNLIGVNTFHNCGSLVGPITFSTNFATFKENAFQGNSSLESINFPSKLKLINDYTFDGCAKLSEKVDFSKSQLQNIREFLFRNYKSVTDLLLSLTITFIGVNALG